MSEERAAAIASCWVRDQAEDDLHTLLAKRTNPKERGDPRHLLGACEYIMHVWGMNTGPVVYPENGTRIDWPPDDLDEVLKASAEDLDSIKATVHEATLPEEPFVGPLASLEKRMAILVLELRSARTALRAIRGVLARSPTPSCGRCGASGAVCGRCLTHKAEGCRCPAGCSERPIPCPDCHPAEFGAHIAEKRDAQKHP